MFTVTDGVSERKKMKTVCFVFVVAFAMENAHTSAQPYTVSACKDGTLLLNCLTGRIRIDDVILGDSRCSGSRCCPRHDDCSGAPSYNYRRNVNTCNGQPSCSMGAEIRNIGCSVWGPSNDYTNITYSCIATPTPPASTIPTTPLPRTLSSSSASTWHHSPTSTSTPIHKHAYSSDDKIAIEIEIEEEEDDVTSTQSSVERSARLNPTHAQKSEQEKSASQVQMDREYLDRVTTLVAVVVGGVVITATVISVAVVLALKKRRIAKSEEHYDMPNYPRSGNNEDENARNSNFYDFIPDSGNCSAGDSASVGCTAKENDYLTPVIENEEAPYLWIP